MGHGLRSGGGEKCRKVRLDVLARVSRLGRGISPSQRAEFPWFSKAWDAHMLAAHGAEWPHLFAETVQALVEEQEKDAAVAAFSQFMHSETHRCLKANAVALALSGPRGPP